MRVFRQYSFVDRPSDHLYLSSIPMYGERKYAPVTSLKTHLTQVDLCNSNSTFDLNRK